MSHKNYKSLKKAILEKAQKGMDEEVLPSIRVYMTNAIDDVVYRSYEPRKYVRRHHRGGGGLDDRKNIVGNFEKVKRNGFEYKIEDVAMPDTIGAPQVYLAPLIIMGQDKAERENYSLLYDEPVRYGFAKPRDFIKETKRNLSQYGNAPAWMLERYMTGK